MRSKYTRAGARRAGDDYQDVVAFGILVDFLEHPTRYQWIRVEADDAGFLDDVVALRSDGKFVVTQVKFSTDPESETDVWTWEKLLEKRKGKTGKLPSFLEKWASSLEKWRKRGSIYEASLVSNRRAIKDIQIALSANGLVDFDKIGDSTIHDTIVEQLGDEATARHFFTEFHFYLDRPGLDDLEESVRRRFYGLGGKHEGWLNLKDELRFWVRNRNQPLPNGAITLAGVRSASLWYRLQSLPQQFEVPDDYVLPSQDFHTTFVQDLLVLPKGCVVLTASPGAGKSTYLSYLFGQLNKQNIPVIRHHYFLSLSDRTVGRFDHLRVAESLMSDIQNNFSDTLGELRKKNPNPRELTSWINACGRRFAQQGRVLVVIIDGLDQVWRERGSIEELNKLFEHLLPTPNGVTVLLGTQPLDDTRLPLRLIHAAPREQWKELPLFDRDAVKRWLQHHEDELDLPKERHSRDTLINRLASTFYEKSQGHPLHLRYTLKALQEQNIPVTERNISRLPGCPTKNIAAYYKELWLSLPEESRVILHLFAACGFPWPKKGIIDCLDPHAQNLTAINRALRQTAHLMVQDSLGLQSFHSSLPIFVQDQTDYTEYTQSLKRCALDWLQTKAPEYWRWAYRWLLEADLGNEQPLVKGPNREWVVEAITKRRPRQEVSGILARSAWGALQHEDLPRCIEVGLLRDYFNYAYKFRSEVLDKLLYPQLSIEEDPHLRARLHANIVNLTEPELVLLAENEASLGNQLVVGKCYDELTKRLNGVRIGSESEISENMRSVLKVAALVDEIDPTRIARFAIKNRKFGRSHEILTIYSENLRTFRVVPPFRQILKTKMTASECSVVLRQAVLLAFEEGFDLAHEISVDKKSSDPFLAVYAALAKRENFRIGNIRFPSTKLLALKEHEASRYRRDIEELFFTIFFSFLGNHLWQKSKRNEEWLQKASDHSWPQSFLSRLNTIASDLAQSLLSNCPPPSGWFYDQLGGFKRPSWPEDRDVYEYGFCAERAANHIALDIMILAMMLGKTPEITKKDLELAFASGYCNPWVWMDMYVARRRKWLKDEAVKWLLQEQAAQLASSVEEFLERASSYTTIASLAALHDLKDEARLYVREVALNLISYGGHKDVLLYGALEVIQVCHKVNIPEAKQWLVRLAPAIAKVRSFTDSAETGHLPRELGDILAEVAPDLLPAYYHWLSTEEEYYDALSVFHSFLRTADLSIEINQALAKTAVDEESLAILVDRRKKQDQGAKTALRSLIDLLGQNVINRIKSKKFKVESKTKYGAHEEQLPPPIDFPPERLMDYIFASKARYFYDREECVRRWLDFWKSAGREEEAYCAVKKEVDRGVELGNYDLMFDLALSLYGKERAYPWLVKAHVERHGWHRYFTRKEQSLRRWKIIKKYYPDRWFRFIQDTMKSAYGEPWHGLTIYDRSVRLVEYCLYMGQAGLAKQSSEQVIASTLELVSPLSLPTPEWVNES